MGIKQQFLQGTPQRDGTGFPPAVYLIGAQKSGTTFLASLLDQHPGICVANPKETDYYTHWYVRGVDYFRECFRDVDGKILVDASTTYSFLREACFLSTPDHPGLVDPVPRRIKEARPDAKLIYILRDPAQRIESAFLHAYRDEDMTGQTITLSEIVRRDPIFLVASRYSVQIERYLEHFDLDDFLFLRFEDLTARPQETVNDVVAFLGLDPVPVDPDQGKRNTRFKINAFGKYLFETRERLVKLGIPVNSIVRGRARQLIRESVFSPADDVKIVLDDEMRAILDEERAAVARLTGLTL